MRRPAPRALSKALEGVVGEAAPASLLARAQLAWSGAVGEAVAAEAQPRSEREGVLTVACSSSLWAAELELLADDMTASLNAALGSPESSSPVRGMRFATGL